MQLIVRHMATMYSKYPPMNITINIMSSPDQDALAVTVTVATIGHFTNMDWL